MQNSKVISKVIDMDSPQDFCHAGTYLVITVNLLGSRSRIIFVIPWILGNFDNITFFVLFTIFEESLLELFIKEHLKEGVAYFLAKKELSISAFFFKICDILALLTGIQESFLLFKNIFKVDQ